MNVSMTTAIVGVGSTAQGQLPGRSANDIAAEAIQLALDDAGISKDEVDGLITCRNLQGRACIDEQVGLLMGMNPAYSATLDYGTGNFSVHLGVMAITAGLANTVVLAYGTNQRSQRVGFGNTVGGGAAFAAAAGLVHVAGPAALAFRRHQHLYGTTEEQLGWIAVAQREWAALNPLSIFRDPLTIDDYLDSPYVAEPLRRPDLTMISDGGAALVLTRADRATDCAKQPVFIAGMAERTALRGYQNPDNLMRPWLAATAADLWRTTGVGPEDVGALYVQDATSVWVLQMLEAYGFCGPGEAGAFLAEGHTRPGGRLPVNTNGGQLSESYMWGWLHLCEAVRQLRGECGDRQIVNNGYALDCSSHDFLKAAATLLTVAA
ncbi:thiolase [Mycolicibacterium murale]|uniref:Thiolase n=1 Tax=Mycolicibacterium murale TaxID=182220 RepID=A0A7I9WX51_9MYCO|nr:thiolase family protein [Mycolicibacterium murale]MCV7182004.1 thiolase family protein [Mycolicibacterium murale]GFG62304.1 thiolase [Mycolicibacterium murale]